jgi:hypothetical protein
MLSPEIKNRLDQTLAMRDKGVFSDSEFVTLLGQLVTANNLTAILDCVPSDVAACVKASVAQRNRGAADDDCLVPEDSPFDVLESSNLYYRGLPTCYCGRMRRSARASCRRSVSPRSAPSGRCDYLSPATASMRSCCASQRHKSMRKQPRPPLM